MRPSPATLYSLVFRTKIPAFEIKFDFTVFTRMVAHIIDVCAGEKPR